jgi:aspartate/methionine/tyrosine aminotransferase
VTCSPTISQAAAIGAFSESGREEMRVIHQRFSDRRDRTVEQLREVPSLHVDPPDGGFYCFIDVRAWGSSVELAKRILEDCNVITIPGEAFGEQGAGFLRISFAAEESELKEGVARIVRAMSNR